MIQSTVHSGVLVSIINNKNIHYSFLKKSVGVLADDETTSASFAGLLMTYATPAGPNRNMDQTSYPKCQISRSVPFGFVQWPGGMRKAIKH